MLFKASDLIHSTLRARDGEWGRVSDFLFHDDSWTVDFVVVDSGSWLNERRVLIPRSYLQEPSWNQKYLDVSLTLDEVRNSPGLETAPPLSYRARSPFYSCYTWTAHTWGGFIGKPQKMPVDPVDPTQSHLRSMREITGYDIEATDGRMGHVEDFLVSDHTWAIPHLVVDTSHWIFGKKVVVPPTAVTRINWDDGTLEVTLTKEEILEAKELKGPLAFAHQLKEGR